MGHGAEPHKPRTAERIFTRKRTPQANSVTDCRMLKTQPSQNCREPVRWTSRYRRLHFRNRHQHGARIESPRHL